VKAHEGDSREEAERKLCEALGRQVADLPLQLALKDRDNENLRSIIRRLAEKVV
jgi:hypothetical protein